MRLVVHGVMRQLFGLILLPLALFAQEARAGILFQTGFEPPTYRVGQLLGQDGWIGPTAPVVQTAMVFSGSQAAEFDSALDTETLNRGQSYAAQDLSYNSVGNPQQFVRFQSEFFVSAAGIASNWDPLAVIANGTYLSQIIIQSNGLTSGGVTDSTFLSVPVTRGQWNSFEIDIDFATRVGSGYMNGIFLGSYAFASQFTTLTQFEWGVNSDPGSDQGFIDNISITSSAVPEPPSLVMLSIATVLTTAVHARANQRGAWKAA